MKKSIAFVITSDDAYNFHLKNILVNFIEDYNVYVIGNLSDYNTKSDININFIKINIQRNFSFYNDLIALYKIIHYINLFKINLVVSLMPKSGFLVSAASLFFNNKTCHGHIFTGQVWVGKGILFKSILICIDKFIAYFSDFALTDSQSQSNFLFNNGIQKYGKPIEVLGHGSLCGVEVIIPKNSKKNYLDKFTISFIARKTHKKGAHFFLDIMEELHKYLPSTFKFFFIGPDENNGKFNSRASKLKTYGVDVEIYDRVDDASEFLFSSHLLILPSFQEGFGSIVIDAASFKVPTIGFSVVGLNDSVIDNYTGFLFEYGDIQSIIKKILYLNSNKLIINEIGENAYDNVVLKYSRQAIIKNYKNYFNNYLND